VTSLIDILRVIQRVHDIHDRRHERMNVNRAMMSFVYRETVLCLKSRISLNAPLSERARVGSM
jgi:hypothetical protein